MSVGSEPAQHAQQVFAIYIVPRERESRPRDGQQEMQKRGISLGEYIWIVL